MAISFAPMREMMKEKQISYYFLANEGIEPGTLQRIRQDRPVTTQTLDRLCRIMDCQPGDLICYLAEET